MKIGILTHHYVNNYGAFLQAYCLRAAIAELFPSAEVRVIDWINRKHLLINSAGFLRFYKGRETLGTWLQKNRLPRVFARARREALSTTSRVYTAKEINALALDAIVVGSDEVWNYRDQKSFAEVKFGCGLDPKTRLVAYAASVGGVSSFEDFSPRLKEALARFSALAVRDDNTERLLKSTLGISPVRVLDPVFLARVPDADTPRIKRLTAKPYILFYYCAPLPEQKRAAIRAYAQAHGLRLLGAGEYDKLYDEPSIDLTPFEWAALFRRAAYVVTGTFHGAVFSLINGRCFTVCPNNPTRAEKLGSLLRGFGLEARLTSPDALDPAVQFALPIDYDAVSAQIALQAQDSKAYLARALQAQDGAPG